MCKIGESRAWRFTSIDVQFPLDRQAARCEGLPECSFGLGAFLNQNLMLLIDFLSYLLGQHLAQLCAQGKGVIVKGLDGWSWLNTRCHGVSI